MSETNGLSIASSEFQNLPDDDSVSPTTNNNVVNRKDLRLALEKINN